MSKEPKATPNSEEFQNSESGLRHVPSVPKKDLYAAREGEKQARTNGNGSGH